MLLRSVCHESSIIAQVGGKLLFHKVAVASFSEDASGTSGRERQAHGHDHRGDTWGDQRGSTSSSRRCLATAWRWLASATTCCVSDGRRRCRLGKDVWLRARGDGALPRVGARLVHSDVLANAARLRARRGGGRQIWRARRLRRQGALRAPNGDKDGGVAGASAWQFTRRGRRRISVLVLMSAQVALLRCRRRTAS